MSFDPNRISVSEIQRDARYVGFCATIKGAIDTARISVRLDIGVGSSVIPGPLEISFPQLLDFAAPQLLGSSLERAIADKFEAMVSRGDANTRLKDFYDILLITKNMSFQFDDVCNVVFETFRYSIITTGMFFR